MRVTWYGTASLVLASEDGTERIAMDPYLRFPDQDQSLIPIFRAVDRVLVTHGHFDHIYDIPVIYGGVDTPVYCTLTPALTLEKRGIPAGRLHVIDPGQTLDLGPFEIGIFQGQHVRFDRPLIRETLLHQKDVREPGHLLQLAEMSRTHPENGEMLFYEIREGEKRLQIMGSLGLKEEIGYPEDADLLIMAFQGRSNLEQCAEPLVARLRPKAVRLYHYDDAFPPISREVETAGFAALIEEKYGISCRAMARGEEIRI